MFFFNTYSGDIASIFLHSQIGKSEGSEGSLFFLVCFIKSLGNGYVYSKHSIHPTRNFYYCIYIYIFAVIQFNHIIHKAYIMLHIKTHVIQVTLNRPLFVIIIQPLHGSQDSILNIQFNVVYNSCSIHKWRCITSNVKHRKHLRKYSMSPALN